MFSSILSFYSLGTSSTPVPNYDNYVPGRCGGEILPSGSIEKLSSLLWSNLRIRWHRLVK